MRQFSIIPLQTRLIRALWSLPFVVLCLLLTLSSLPLGAISILAAPPEPSANTEEDNPVASDHPSALDDAKSAQIDLLPDETSATATDESAASKRSPKNGPRFESIRRRGLEAPVQLRQDGPAAPREAEEADKGDGEPPQDRSTSDSGTNKDTERKDSPKRSPRQSDIRVWPMRGDSYSFTQAFGCTQQIANFYFPDPGCPASAPVVHSGIDLAAPEGTPFYAAASGWVTGSGYDREVGVPNTRIIIQHDGRNDGYATEYLHWIASFVEVGDYVEAGEQIGEVGSVGYSTGPHLHFSVVDLDSGEHTDPVRWLPDETGATGYRGIRPKTRAQMRLPAGTTAGVPESADPAPPPLPEREEVPESPQPEKDKSKDGRKGKDKGKDKDRSGKKQERRAEKRTSKDDQADQSAEESAETPETTSDDTAREGKDKERTKKRERNKDGKQSENADGGEDGGKKKSKDDKNDSSENGKSNRGRHGNGNGNGNGNGHRNGNGSSKNHQNDKGDDGKVKERKSNNNGNQDTPLDDGNGEGDNGDQDTPSGDDGSTGDGSGSGGENKGDKGGGGNGERENGAETRAEEPPRAGESGDSGDQATSETRGNTDKEKNRGTAESGE